MWAARGRYARLGEAHAAGQLSERAFVVATYALCGFSNFGSMGITLGTLSAICPPLRAPLARDLLRALAAGTLACLSTACMASAIYSPDREFDSYECDSTPEPPAMPPLGMPPPPSP